jgi:hypothetical protein
MVSETSIADAQLATRRNFLSCGNLTSEAENPASNAEVSVAAEIASFTIGRRTPMPVATLNIMSEESEIMFIKSGDGSIRRSLFGSEVSKSSGISPSVSTIQSHRESSSPTQIISKGFGKDAPSNTTSTAQIKTSPRGGSLSSTDTWENDIPSSSSVGNTQEFIKQSQSLLDFKSLNRTHSGSLEGVKMLDGLFEKQKTQKSSSNLFRTISRRIHDRKGVIKSMDSLHNIDVPEIHAG